MTEENQNQVAVEDPKEIKRPESIVIEYSGRSYTLRSVGLTGWLLRDLRGIVRRSRADAVIELYKNDLSKMPERLAFEEYNRPVNVLDLMDEMHTNHRLQARILQAAGLSVEESENVVDFYENGLLLGQICQTISGVVEALRDPLFATLRGTMEDNAEDN